MSKPILEPGRVVISRAGRDQKRRLLVLAMDADYAWVADGDVRKADSPKKKKHMHLTATPTYFPSVAGSIQEGKVPSDAEIRTFVQEPSREE